MNINSTYSLIQQSTVTTTGVPATGSSLDFNSILQGKKAVSADQDTSTSSSSDNSWRDTDFSKLTPKQMREISNDMYHSGAIDFDAMANLQMIGPLGKAGPNGEFIPFTNAEREQIDNTPINYLTAVADQRANIERMGRTLDPTSGYSSWVKLDKVLNQAKQSVDVTV